MQPDFDNNANPQPPENRENSGFVLNTADGGSGEDRVANRRFFPGPTGFVLLTLLVIGLSVLVHAVLTAGLGLGVSEMLPPLWMGLETLFNSLLWLAVAVVALRLTDQDMASRLFLQRPPQNAWPLVGLAFLCGVVMVLPALWLQIIGSKFLPQLD